MSYRPSFDNSTTGKFNPDSNYISLKAGSDAYLTEDDFNEMQWIQIEQRAQAIRSIIPSGFLSNTFKITDQQGDENGVVYTNVKENSNLQLIKDAIYYNIKSYIPVNINGYVFRLAGDKNYSPDGTNVNNKGILINFNKLADTVETNTLVYLEASIIEIKGTEYSDSPDNVYKYGNKNLVDASLNKITDPRLNVPTSRRTQLQWTIKTVDNIDFTKYPLGVDDITKVFTIDEATNVKYTYTQCNNKEFDLYNGKFTFDDPNLFVAKVPNEKIINKLVFALPMFKVHRKGNLPINIDEVIDLRPTCLPKFMHAGSKGEQVIIQENKDGSSIAIVVSGKDSEKNINTVQIVETDKYGNKKVLFEINDNLLQYKGEDVLYNGYVPKTLDAYGTEIPGDAIKLSNLLQTQNDIYNPVRINNTLAGTNDNFSTSLKKNKLYYSTIYEDINDKNQLIEGTALFYNGNFIARKIFNPTFNDYAEYFLKGEELEPGDVIVKNDSENNYIKSTKYHQKSVIGVVSDEFAHCIGGDAGLSLLEIQEKFAPIGLAGRVKVKVTGDIEIGDLLTTSNLPGIATKSKRYTPGTILGKALEKHSGSDVNKIQMLIMNV